ncbi:hypothetical protein MMC30_001502, partial [Trapelia coarctata]|nr:hypothetical protein [Trapelia coarctata]
VSFDTDWQTVSQRFGIQRGALDAILRTRGRLLIQYPDKHTMGIAKQIAQNLYQYFATDCEIVDSASITTASQGNIISVVQGSEDTSWNIPSYAVELRSDKGIFIRDGTGQIRHYPFDEGLGAVFLQPLADERLQLIVWGFDEAGLRYASRLVPMLTGVGQADFVVVSKECLWKGAAGALAMGSFDHAWNVSHGSFLK